MIVQYAELGWPDTAKMTYREGDVMRHPSGAIYKRINGNWQVIQMPDSTPAEQAS